MSRTAPAARATYAPGGAFAPIVLVLAIYLAVATTASFLCDDAFITFRYAENLSDGYGPVYNIGERVEGYTNFLWMVLIALVMKLGGGPELWSQVISIACSAGIVALLIWWGKNRGGDWQHWLLLPAFLAFTAPFIVWSSGGLETAAYSLLLLLGILYVIRAAESGSSNHALLAGLFAGLAILTRPDGVIVTGLSGLYLLYRVIRKKIPLYTLLGYAAPLVLLVGGHLLWRLSYYGKLLPNTFYVKAPAAENLPFGAKYFARFVYESGIWFAFAAVVLLNVQRRQWRLSGTFWYLLTTVVVFSAFIIYTGGDFMVMGRFFVPMLGVIFLLLQEMLAVSRSHKRSFALVPALLLVLHTGYSAYMLNRAYAVHNAGLLDSVGLLKEYHDQWTRAGKLLKGVAQPNDTVLTSAAGIIPFYSKLYTIDLLGLTAPDLSKYRVRPGPFRPGHSVSISPGAFFTASPQFFVGHPSVRSVDSASIGWGTLNDVKDGILSKYHMASVPLPDDTRTHFYFWIRNDAIPRLPQGSRVSE